MSDEQRSERIGELRERAAQALSPQIGRIGRRRSGDGFSGRASDTPDRLVVAGRGNLGRSLARALHARLISARSAFKPPPDGIVFLAVPDAVIGEVAARIAATDPAPAVSFVHLSGALTLDVLAPLRGHAVGSFHPLQSFPFPREPGAFRGITIAVDASTPALLRKLQRLARNLGARPRKVAADERVLYHAAAVYASNFVVAAVGEGVRQLMRIGWSEEDATRALLPLLDGVVANLRRKGVRKAMTGPIRRGDAETVRRHLEAVDRPDSYRILGSIALEIAREAGLDPAAAERVRRALTRDVAATRRRLRR